jgi:hypothetical protein
MSFFRDEYIKAKREQRLGSVSVRPDRIAYRVLVLFVALAIGIFLVAANLSYEENVDCHGIIANAEVDKIVSLPIQESKVVRWYVKPGDLIAPGTVLVQVHSSSAENSDVFVGSLNTRAYFEPEPSDEGASVFSIASTVGGVVSKRFVLEGASSNYGRPLASIVPEDRKLGANVLVPVRAIRSVSINERLMLKGWQSAGKSVYAKVVAISDAPLAPLELSTLLGVPPPPERQYLVSMELEDGEAGLVAGQDVTLRVPLNRQSLISWLARFRRN